jgi:hypothetical protein
LGWHPHLDDRRAAADTAWYVGGHALRSGLPDGRIPQLRDWIVVAGRSEQRRDDYPECDRMTSSTDAQEMAKSGVAAHALLFEPLTLHDLTIENRTWLSPMCQHMVTVEDGVGIWCISAHERRAGLG